MTQPEWHPPQNLGHYNDVIMGTIVSQITSLTIVYSTVYSDADQRKHQSFASLAFVWGIHRGPVNSPHKWPVTRKMSPFDDVIMDWEIGVDLFAYLLQYYYITSVQPRFVVTRSIITRYCYLDTFCPQAEHFCSIWGKLSHIINRLDRALHLFRPHWTGAWLIKIMGSGYLGCYPNYQTGWRVWWRSMKVIPR